MSSFDTCTPDQLRRGYCHLITHPCPRCGKRSLCVTHESARLRCSDCDLRLDQLRSHVTDPIEERPHHQHAAPAASLDGQLLSSPGHS